MNQPLRIAATITTFNRKDVLRRSLVALLEQSHPVDEIIVIDNASTDGTAEMVRKEFSSVRLVSLPDNTGAAGGFSAGLRHAQESGYDWTWIFNDDDMAAAGALEEMLQALDSLPPSTGILACGRSTYEGARHPLGSTWQHRHSPLRQDGDPGPVPADVVTFSGTLVSVPMSREIGFPRPEFFMMIEDLDYCLRARDAGWKVFVVPTVLTTSLTMGSEGMSPPWRGYYQTRNQLAMSLSRRSPIEVFWWGVRTAKLCVAALQTRDRARERVGLRLLGAWHGLRGVSGARVLPTPVIASSSSSSTSAVVERPPTQSCGEDARLFGVLVTYRRPEALAQTLRSITEQSCRLSELVVVDNGSQERVAAIVGEIFLDESPVTYIRAEDNLGPAGGLSVGVARVSEIARDEDWVVFLDDDNPPPDDGALEDMVRLACKCHTEDERVAAVGLVGARFDAQRGRLLRPRDEELHSTVEVDYIGGGQIPLYRMGALRAVGPPRADFFFGFDDLELGFRLRRAGFFVLADGQRWRSLRTRYRRLGTDQEPTRSVVIPPWRQYYSLRNLIVLLRLHGYPRSAAMVTVRSCIGSPLVAALRRQSESPLIARYCIKASYDAWTWRMGRRVEPKDAPGLGG